MFLKGAALFLLLQLCSCQEDDRQPDGDQPTGPKSPLEIAQRNLELLQSQLPVIASDDLAHSLRKDCPPVNCYGLDCAFVTDNGCKSCACPIGSPARGCDRLPEKLWSDIMQNGCPNATDINRPRYAVRQVIRWYRFVDSERNIDECRFYMFPYCDESDFNFWRSPRTHAECTFYCYRQQGVEQSGNVEVHL